ncbi:hypothetical protein N7462_001200 [Penicillium macrosclerotiorum]|uniref:uncharacterized protein n=1 Tax=Penicillium macrosclerotiorum TaxID=303699 RepID=UPI002549BD2B|nr:uncharacterized protein N7462_001200 [Penicillium macrosclerotiorum]KAJ5691777.1 hypothetical protein N7462_001200 [Penicillium macrosclerotiorum]
MVVEGEYSPDLNDEHLFSLVTQIKDWQCFPTPFPRAKFHQAVDLQKIFNRLYCAVAADEGWIFNAIRDLVPHEPLASALWGIHRAVKLAGYAQSISVGIFRSDYMLHCNIGEDLSGSPNNLYETSLAQVELNTFSSAGAAHANKVADMHRYLEHTGIYNKGDISVDLVSLPLNTNIESLASCLALAHTKYGPPKSQGVQRTAILFIVQPRNFNIADERPIEYALWNQRDPVPAYRLEFGQDVLQYTWLNEDRQLLFHPPWIASKAPLEISVIYMRAGYEADEYNEVGREARLQLEKSTAIKCPSLLAHLATFKKVQQALTIPGALERFLGPQEVAAIRQTLVPIYPLDESESGMYAREVACDPEQCSNYILKPSLEGGGHNIYGDKIPGFLASIPKYQWPSYILMQKIVPPTLPGLLMGPAGVDDGEVVSELGILGCCLWQVNQSSEIRCDMLHNSVGGWTFKSKHAYTNEMSVVKGYGCFDTPRLVEP